MRTKDGYLLRNIAGEWFIVPIGSDTLNFNGIMQVSETGAFFWKMLESGSDRNALIEALLGEYEIDRGTAEEDLDEFLKNLDEKGLLRE